MRALAIPAFAHTFHHGTIHVKQLAVKQIKGTKHSPQVRYHENVNLMWVSGNCNSQDALDVLCEAVDMTEEHLTYHDNLTLVLDIHKVNSSSIKMLMNYFNRLKNHFRNEKEILVTWMVSFENDEMMDLAIDIISLYGVKIELKPY
jgi:hypothetical protein